MEIILLIAALVCAAASVAAALSLSRCLRALDAREGADWTEAHRARARRPVREGRARTAPL